MNGNTVYTTNKKYEKLHKQFEEKKNKYYPDYEQHTKKVSKEETHREFGKAFDVSSTILTGDDAFKAAYAVVLDDFLAIRKDNFPDWKGLPEMHTRSTLKGEVQLVWYAKVPIGYIINPDDKLENDLWNS